MTARALCPLFVRPLPPPAEGGWRGGLTRPAKWTLQGDMVDRAAFHALLRASGLPREELLALGCTAAELGQGRALPASRVARLLGAAVMEILHPEVGEHIAWLAGTDGSRPSSYCEIGPFGGLEVNIPALAEWPLAYSSAVSAYGWRVLSCHCESQ